jgi:HNH endonuclease
MPIGVYERTKPIWNKGKKGLQVAWNKGKKRSWSSPAEFKKGLVPWNKGLKGAQIAWNKGIVNANFIGEKNPNWKGGVTLIKDQLRKSIEWKNWRESVFKRDKFTCQECGYNKGGNLQPHHIIPIRECMIDIFNMKNGITLCRPCHMKTVYYESSFAEKYFAIIK